MRAMATFLQTFDRFAASVLPVRLPDATVLRVRSMASVLKLGRDQIADLGLSQPSLVFIARGATKLVAHTTGGREQVVGFHFEADLVIVPYGGAHFYCLQALTDSELVVMPYAPFRRLACGDPRILERLLAACEQPLQRLRDKAVALGRKTAPERVADFLLSMASRIGVRRDGETVFELPMSRRDIADSLGLTIETVSRQFTQLREDGIIETQGRAGVCLLDLPRLEARSGRVGLMA